MTKSLHRLPFSRHNLATLLCLWSIALVTACAPAASPQPAAEATSPPALAKPTGRPATIAIDTLTPTEAASPSATQLSPATPTPLAPTQAATETIPQPGPDVDVMQVQARLLELGYAEAGWADGDFTSQTQAALRHFQYLNSLEISGLPDERTLAALFDPSAVAFHLSPPFPGVVIGPGVPFGDDQALHSRLAQLGYLAQDEPEWIQNQYGPATQAAVRRFQGASGLEASGAVDLETWRALFSPWAVDASGQPLLRPAETTWITNIYPVGENPYALAYDGKRLWVAHHSSDSYLDNAVLPIDPSAGALDLNVPILISDPQAPLPQSSEGILFADGRLWLLFPNADNPGETPFLKAVNIDTGIIGEALHFGECPDGYCMPSSAFGFDGSSLWASAGDRVFGIDPASKQPVQSYQVGWLAHGTLVYAGQCLWMGGEEGLTAFNPRGGECPYADMAYALPSDGVAFDGQRLWAASASGGFVISLDLTTGEMGNPIDVGGGPRALAFDGQRLWIAQEEASAVIPLDIASGAIGDPMRVGQQPVALLYAGERLWIACAGSHTVQVMATSPEPDQPLASPSPPQEPLSTNAPPTAAPVPTLTRIPTSTKAQLSRELRLASPRMEGDDVLLIQQRLLALGYSEVGMPDGIFGPLTEQAVRHFQQVNGLVVDGVVGPVTWAALFGPTALSP
jgi:peptidoglycan hydrolase-like protein with peptidoglycan-binding domain